MTDIKIGDRTIHLLFNMDVWETFDEVHHRRIDEVLQTLEGLNDTRAIVDIFVEMARAGDEIRGNEPITRKWLTQRMAPGDLAVMANLCVNTMIDGLKTTEDEDGKPRIRDLVLEEIKKKDGQSAEEATSQNA